MEMLTQAFEVVRDWAFPVSGLLLCLYPVAILLWTVVEGGRAAAAARKDQDSDDQPLSPKSLEEENSSSEVFKGDVTTEKKGRNRGAVLPLAIAVGVAVALLGTGLGFACSASGVSGTRGSPGSMNGPAGAAPLPGAAESSGSTYEGMYMGATVGAALAAGLAVAGVAASHRSRSTACADGAGAVPRYTPPPANGVSLWHDVDLHVNSWVEEDTGLYRYVNEMPRGCLQKFEVQPHLPDNAVEEDPKGSSRLAAFGQPVPFNYGCFPQTFRDPNRKDEMYGAPGDNDPLDVLDLATEVVGVGKVVRCRPLGAVCLIDEGEADWKILAVNVDASEPLAKARSIEEVHRIAPGRISECLQWIDDFKKSSGKDEATLDFQVHEMSTALRLIKQDHSCWHQLLNEAGSDNMARGHWVRQPRRVIVPQHWPAPQHALPKLGRWPTPMLVPNQPLRLPTPWPLVGASPAMAASRTARTTPTLRRQDVHATSTSCGSSP